MGNKTRRRYIRSIVTGLLAFVFVLAPYTGVVDVAAASSCSKWLTPHTGSLFSEHNNWLESPIPYNGGVNDYTIINMRTYQSYHWDFWGNFNGHARFGVSTSWIWYNLFWYNDPWLLVYKC